jgi:predicted DNA-binding WGR domain protein
MPRYEFKEGTSNKFWEINLDGSSFTTTYGKIGTDGQTTEKSYGDDDKAQKEYDKLIAEKTKKGYKLVSGNGGGGAAKPAAAAKGKKAELFEDEGDDDEEEKPKAKPASKGNSKSGSGRYFEFVEGTSSKFWEIKLDGDSFTTRYGKIGTPGQETLKDMGSAEKAKKEYDKLIAEKTKKGYVEK